MNSLSWYIHTKISTFQNWLFRVPNPNHLKGTTRPTRTNRYKAKDGNYYNGVMFSPDLIEILELD